MPDKVIRFYKGGGMRKFAAPGDRACSTCMTRRASHIEPQNLLLRLVFHCVRRIVDDESRMAAFTRKWPCKWRARIFDPNIPPVVLGPYSSRDDALDAEIQYITDVWIREGLEPLDSRSS